MAQYLAKLLAFGYESRKRNQFLFETLICLYAVVFEIVDQQLMNRDLFAKVMFGLLVFLLLIRYLPRNYALT